MKETKPIKRSPQLAPLSREHHDGLLFSWKLKQGMTNKTPVEKLKQYSVWFWQHYIKPHFFQEEKFLLPYIPADHPFAQQLKDEHAHIREIVLGLDNETDYTCFTHLADLLDSHIRFEERQLFPFLEESIATDELNAIQQQLEEHPVIPTVWEDEFWVKK